MLLSVGLLAAGCGGAKTSQTGFRTNRTEVSASPQPASPQLPQQPSNKTDQSSSRCDPNYSPCVPIASDVDCAGGGGDGPVYVKGPIRVIGTDIYGLDRDGDGIACEK